MQVPLASDRPKPTMSRRQSRRRIASAVLAGLVGATAATAANAFSVYVTNEKDNTISVIDGGSLKETAKIKVGRRPGVPPS